ncbi:MAG TPA: hypothetical protein VGX95_15245 [Xanthobacteraceae bacterium]|nr:hypothetical protein [Xanthobacteraceae bacterium]
MARRPDGHKILFPDEIILRTDNFIVAQDWEVPIKGFYIIASRQQRTSITEFNDREVIELGRLQKLIRECMKTLFGILEVYFFQNEDSSHGFHVWLFPRHAWMDKIAGRKIESVRPIMEHAIKHASDEVFREIRAANNHMRNYLDNLSIQDYLDQDLLGGDGPVLNIHARDMGRSDRI